MFVVASVLTLYALSPYLWGDPVALGEAVAVLSQHPIHAVTLFQGEPLRWPDIPADYLPTWIAITTPPGVLLLGLVGAVSVMHRGLISPGTVLGDPVARFGLLLVACLVLPVVAVLVVNANLYDGWRQVYFSVRPGVSAGGVRAALAGGGLSLGCVAAGRVRAGGGEPGRGWSSRCSLFIRISISISTPWWTGVRPTI